METLGAITYFFPNRWTLTVTESGISWWYRSCGWKGAEIYSRYPLVATEPYAGGILLVGPYGWARD